jgi:hypothetical protein
MRYRPLADSTDVNATFQLAVAGWTRTASTGRCHRTLLAIACSLDRWAAGGWRWERLFHVRQRGWSEGSDASRNPHVGHGKHGAPRSPTRLDVEDKAFAGLAMRQLMVGLIGLALAAVSGMSFGLPKSVRTGHWNELRAKSEQGAPVWNGRAEILER